MTTCDNNEQADWSALNFLVVNYQNYTEPDLFSVSAPGLSAQFVLGPDGTPRLLTHNDLTIEFQPSPQTPTTIVIKTNSGIVYTFGATTFDRDIITRRGYVRWAKGINSESNYYKSTEATLITFFSRWKLSSIASSTKTASIRLSPFKLRNDGVDRDI